MLVAAVGPATAAALESAGRHPDLVAVDHEATGLATAMLGRGIAGGSVWFPAAEGRAATSPRRSAQAEPPSTSKHIYRSVMPESAPERLRAAFGAGVDAITLTSGSTARHLVDAVGVDGVPASTLIVCIGEQTAAEARHAGLAVGSGRTEPPRLTALSTL